MSSDVEDVIASISALLGLCRQDGYSLAVHHPQPPHHVHVEPPKWACTTYKLVALIDGCPTSVYDGSTTFPVGTTVFQAAEEDHLGGLYVYTTIEECLQAGVTHFPRRSRLHGAPLALAKALAWNFDGARLPVSYGSKKSYSFVRLVELLPTPVTWRHSAPVPAPQGEGGALRVARDDGGAPRTPPQAAEAQPGSRWQQLRQHQQPAALAPWLSGSRSTYATPSSLARAQVRTVHLEMDVAEMEQQLAFARAMLRPADDPRA